LTQILIFRRNLERMVASDDELREEVRTTLLHETGHFFGLDEAALGELGLG
jgi:predicted Zn-dependent protease with MMP-like domain